MHSCCCDLVWMHTSQSLLATHNGSNRADLQACDLQGLPDAVSPESVLTLVDTLQTQALKTAEQLGQKDSELASLKGISPNQQAFRHEQRTCIHRVNCWACFAVNFGEFLSIVTQALSGDLRTKDL